MPQVERVGDITEPAGYPARQDSRKGPTGTDDDEDRAADRQQGQRPWERQGIGDDQAGAGERGQTDGGGEVGQALRHAQVRAIDNEHRAQSQLPRTRPRRVIVLGGAKESISGGIRERGDGDHEENRAGDGVNRREPLLGEARLLRAQTHECS